MTNDSGYDVERQIAQWREYVGRRGAVGPADVDELDAHLRDQIDDLTRAGLSPDEAFLVAVKRLGAVDTIAREFARVYSERLWKQLVVGSDDDAGTRRTGLVAAIVLAVVAAVAVKVPALAGVELDGDDAFFARNIGFFALVPLIAYFAWDRRMRAATVLAGLVVPVAVLAVAINAYPFAVGDQTFVLAVICTPVVLWFVVGFAYADGRWRDHARRMDAVRFSGEWAIYYALIALGGGVLVGITAAAFDLLGLDSGLNLVEWVVLPGAMGAVVVAAWLVEAKQSVIENMAPVLTRVFTPLTGLMLVALLTVTVVAGDATEVDRGLLILVDIVLILVLALVLYAISARDPLAPAGLFDRLQLAVVVLALALDVVMLTAMLARIADGGVTANKAFAVGLNVVVLVNLLWSAWLGLAFVRAGRPLARLERWQTTYLPVFAVWATVVALVFPVVFGFA